MEIITNNIPEIVSLIVMGVVAILQHASKRYTDNSSLGLKAFVKEKTDSSFKTFVEKTESTALEIKDNVKESLVEISAKTADSISSLKETARAESDNLKQAYNEATRSVKESFDKSVIAYEQKIENVKKELLDLKRSLELVKLENSSVVNNLKSKNNVLEDDVNTLKKRERRRLENGVK